VHTPSDSEVEFFEQNKPFPQVSESEHVAPEAKARQVPDEHCPDKQLSSDAQLCPGRAIGNWHFPEEQGNPEQSDDAEQEEEGVKYWQV